MRCEMCDGRGFVRDMSKNIVTEGAAGTQCCRAHLPCPVCQGSGIAYCCEGEDVACDLTRDH